MLNSQNGGYCDKCKEISDMIAERQTIDYYDFDRSLRLDDEALQKMADDGRMELFAGECQPSELLNICSEEAHYTVSAVLKCSGCGKYFYAGYCCRGNPVLKEYSAEDALSFAQHMEWGFEGTYFKQAVPAPTSRQAVPAATSHD